jgi:hypothetical protein
MEKVRLTVDELRVQSFATTGHDPQPRGSVHAHDAPTDQVECPTYDAAWESCWETCGDCYTQNTCYETCGQCLDTGPICVVGSWTAPSDCW